MHHRTRRGLALLSATAALAGGTLATVSPASASAAGPLGGLLDPVTTLLTQVTLATVEVVQVLIAGLSDAVLGDALVAANPGQLTKLLAAADANGQLAGALDTLTAGELATVVDGLSAPQTGRLLGGADAAQLDRLLAALTSRQLAAGLAQLDAAPLTTIVGGLTPAEIGGLLAAGGSGSVIAGLLGQATALAGGAPAAAPVDTLLGQVDALLAAGLPAQLGDLAALLTSTQALLGTSGLDGAGLGALLATASGLVATAPAPVAAPLQALAARLTELLAPAGGGGEGDTPADGGAPGGGEPAAGGSTGGGTTTPATPNVATPRPAASAPRPAAPATTARPPAAAAAASTAYRATFGPIRVNAKRTRVTFTLACPASAPRGCAVTLNGRFAGAKAMRTMQIGLPRATTTPVTVTISRSTTKRLKRKGGSLTLTARTAGSSLATATGRLKVRRLAARR